MTRLVATVRIPLIGACAVYCLSRPRRSEPPHPSVRAAADACGLSSVCYRLNSPTEERPRSFLGRWGLALPNQNEGATLASRTHCNRRGTPCDSRRTMAKAPVC